MRPSAVPRHTAKPSGRVVSKGFERRRDERVVEPGVRHEGFGSRAEATDLESHVESRIHIDEVAGLILSELETCLPADPESV